MPDTAVPTENSAHQAAGTPRFTCRQSAGERVTFVTLTGELDLAAAGTLDAVLRSAAATPLVILDLRGLEFIDSSGAHVVLAADRRIRTASGRMLVLVETGGEIEWLLTLIGADRQLVVIDQDARSRAATAVAG